MDFSLALRYFAFVLTLISLALIPLIVRRGSLIAAPSPLPPGRMPRPCWPAALMRLGIVCLLLSFVVLMMLFELVLSH